MAKNRYKINIWKILLDFLPLFAVVILAIFFRFYNFDNRISIGLDSARDAFVSLEGARMFQFPLTGPFISIAPVTTGPWYWIQLILARIILPTSYAPWLLLGIYSTLMVIVLYGIGYLLEGKRLGFILALITALSSNQLDTSVQLTNPSVIGFYSSIYILLFIYLLKKGKDNRRLGFLIGLILGITVNTHYQAVGLFSLLLTLFIYRKKYLKTLISAGFGFAITFLPLLVFELNNHWHNTRHMIQYLTVDQYAIWMPFRWRTYITDFWTDFISFVVGGTRQSGMLLMGAIIAGFTFLIVKRKLPKVLWLLIFSFIIEVIIIRYYRGEKFFGYLQFFHPYIFIFIGYLINKIFSLRFGMIGGALILGFYIFMIYPSVSGKLAADSFTRDTNILVKGIYNKFGSGPYTVYKCQNLTKSEIVAIVLKLDMDGRYGQGGKKLWYQWGCSLPNVLSDGTVVSYTELAKDPGKIFPRLDLVFDISAASPSSITKAGLKEASPKSMYQSAARWWMDEQP